MRGHEWSRSNRILAEIRKRIGAAQEEETAGAIRCTIQLMRASTKKNLALESPGEAPASHVVELNAKLIERAREVVAKNGALAKVYERLLKIVAETTLEEARRRYDIGRLVRQVMEDEKKYGKRSVETLATLLRFDKSTLRDYASVAKTWNTNEFNAVLRRKTAAGLGLRFSHLVVLAQVADGRRREALITRTLEESLTVRQLKELVHPSVTGGDGTSEAPPTAAEAISRVAARWEAAADEIGRETRELVRLASSRTPEVLVLVRAAADRQRVLAKKAVACADELDGLAEA